MARAHKTIHLNDTTELSPKMQQALASLHLEGIELTEEAMDDLRLFDIGQLSKVEVIKRALARAKIKSK